MRKTGFFILFAIFSAKLVFSQPLNITISELNSPEEPCIVINPNQTNQIVAGANIDNYYYSDNYGLSWETGTLKSTYGVWGDPIVTCDKSGTFYFFHLSKYDKGSWIDRLVCQKSINAGKTWTLGTFVGLNGEKAQDKEAVSINKKTNTIYITWTQFDKYKSTSPEDSTIIQFSKSENEGKTWTKPLRINKKAGDCLDDDKTVMGAVSAIGANSEIYVTWCNSDGLMFDYSLDDGKTWLENDILISITPEGWDFKVPGIFRCNGLPFICCDTSQSQYNGNIYICWSDQRNGINNTDIWLTKSENNGKTFSKPLKVNDDKSHNHQFFAAMTVDPITGFLYIVFYDRRNYKTKNTDVYLAISKDGGETFINLKISEKPFYPDEKIFFGDYIGISSYNNMVRPIWSRLHEDKLSIITSLIYVNENGFIFSDCFPRNLEVNSFDNCKNENQMEFSSGCQFELYDITNKKISTKSQFSYSKNGINSFSPDKIKISSGFYYMKIISEELTETRKMLIK